MSQPANGVRTALRRRMRAARRSVETPWRVLAARSVADRVAGLGLPLPRSRVAAYLPLDSELDPGPVIALARERGCRVYAPVVTSFARRRMRFGLLPAGAGTTRRNRWGILEPDSATSIDGRWFSLVLVPCVAFDADGARLGMGAGFYDRHFAFLMHRSSWHRPRLLGLAYDCQRVARLEQRSWDVPLWGVVTETGVYGRAARGLPPAAVRETH